MSGPPSTCPTATVLVTRGPMRQTEQERVVELEAESAFQRQTLRTIRVVAEKAPEEAQVALKAIGALANEALAEAERQDHDHRS
jgi:uncharacterized coiled-coil protein SlyX